ncbi:energy transducer TonB [Polyangium jinanense]|uniref:Energy transducer TonB n=1 Tax=Polyangium jinanense TaxID=2829994 RepID=A0A9X3X1F7_9BACT|nr:energy transducer TonB [Polyangium jinanense]MDC3954472.1 energy transducer TonB [Polyangium jinanense]MDC3980775.1 energy transducer TonB [Polyangium jinanense]
MDHGHLSAGWLVAATVAHVVLLGAGFVRDESGAIVRDMREAIRAQLVAFEIPIEAPRPTPPEEPPPEPPAPPAEPPPPAPQPVAIRAPAPPQNDPPETPPSEVPEELPTPMEAPPVLVQESGPPDPSAVTFVTGDGAGTGLVSTFGSGFRPVRHTGLGGGAPPRRPSPPPPPDLSRPASLYGDRAWDCDFPPEAEAAGIRNALVVLQIVVRADGRAQKVEVVSDPGYGFGAQARYCAAQHHYRPALDRAGQPTQASLGPVRIRFVR